MFQETKRIFKRFKKNIIIKLGGFYGINIILCAFTNIYYN